MKLNGINIVVVRGDITEIRTDAIVKDTNEFLSMDLGLSAYIIKAKGRESIEKEAIKEKPAELGDVILTKVEGLQSKYVMHAVMNKAGFIINEDIIRTSAKASLDCAQKNKMSSIAFSALGCGPDGYSYEASSKIMAQEVFRYIRDEKTPTLKEINFVLETEESFNVFEKNVRRYLEYITKKLSQGPFITVDGIVEYDDGIVLIERSNPPLGWALPGGFVDYGESVEAAVVREIKEEITLDLVDFKLFKVCSDPNRDPRFHTVTIVFTGKGKGVLKADSDAKGAKVFKLDSLPEKMAFDHREVIEEYIEKIARST